MFSTTKASGAADSGPSDPQFNYVSLLLHGDGTNGAQNNTFVDSSVNNSAISRGGAATQGTFSPFSRPAGYWAVNINGSTGYITFPNSSNFAFGTAAFTIEFWINMPSMNDKFILGGRTAIGTMHITTGGFSSTVGALRYVGSSTITSGTTVITDNTWHHCAIVRDASSNVVLYVDGVSRGTGTDTTNYTTTSGTWYLASNDSSPGGNIPTGYLSNFRIVKGTAVYTANFTPPTTPLTAVTNTSLLALQSNRLIDTSSSAVALTATQGVVVSLPSPFNPTSSYSPTTTGGSAYFGGTGDYLTIGSSAPMTFGTSAFTIEAWVYTAEKTVSVGASRTIIGNSGNGYTMQLYIDSGNGRLIFGNTGSYNLQGSSNIANSAWNHVVIVRNGSGTTSLYVNGVREGSNTNGTNYSSSTIYIGAFDPGNGFWNGYISGLCITNGSALYDPSLTTISVPTAPPTAGTNTALLLNGVNAGVFDNAAINDLVTVGTAQVSTAVAKFGTGSVSLAGATSYLQAPASPPIALGAGDFTLETWCYISGGSGFRSIFSTRTLPDETGSSAVSAVFFGLSSGNALYYDSYATPLSGSTALTSSTWNHIACVRNGSTITMYLNGVSQGTVTDGAVKTLRTMYIGGQGSNYNFVGYLDEVRVTVGIARYTANFTPPTAAFPNK